MFKNDVSCGIFRPAYGGYALQMLVEIYFDYILSNLWQDFEEIMIKKWVKTFQIFALFPDAGWHKNSKVSTLENW